jgi:phosphoglycerol transferase MdoB-like AlkP superfamily enzyme
MMCGMGSMWMMALYLLLSLFVVLGFGYIIWTMAAKESGNAKLAGQIIAVVIIVLAVILAFYGAVNGPKMNKMMGQGMMDQNMMMKQQDMMKGMEKMPREMKKMMRENMRR